MKVGDRVRILGKTTGDSMKSCGILVGSCGTIKRFYTHGYKEPFYPKYQRGQVIVEPDVRGAFMFETYRFNETDLELIKEEKVKFKVGDKVRILGKNVDSYTLDQTGWKIGDIKTITSINISTLQYTLDKMYYFTSQDLELVENKFVINKEKGKFTFVDFLEEVPLLSLEEMASFVNNFMLPNALCRYSNLLIDSLVEYAESKNCLFRFLTSKKYIIEGEKEEEKEVFYSIGDRFRNDNFSWTCVLCATFYNPRRVTAVIIEGDDINQWKTKDGKHIMVKDFNRITKEEVKELFGTNSPWERVTNSTWERVGDK